MKRQIIFLMFLLASLNLLAQPDWHFETKIERNTHCLLEDSIAGQISEETKTSILLYSRGMETLSFDLTEKLKDLKDVYGVSIGGAYIETIKLEASKKVDNDFYLIFSFSQPSVPGSNGFGYCGAGYENYLGFLHINSFEVEEFKYYQTNSCLKEILEEYVFDQNEPEKGVRKINNSR